MLRRPATADDRGMNRTLTTAGTLLLLAGLAACGPADKPKAATTPSPSASPSPTETRTKAKTSADGKTATAPKLPIAQARKKAAAILEQEDTDFRNFLTQGEKAVGTPQWPAWDQKALVGLDMKQTAFSKADAYFTADNEPTDLLEAWRSDNGDANADITRFGGTGPVMDATSRQVAADCLAALAKADKDAEKIANGG